MPRRRLPSLLPEVATAAAPQLPVVQWRHVVRRAGPAVVSIGRTVVGKVPLALESVAAEVRPAAGRDHIPKGPRIPRPLVPMMMRHLPRTTLPRAPGQPGRLPRGRPGPRPRCRCESASAPVAKYSRPLSLRVPLLVEIRLQPARLPRVPVLSVRGRPVILVDLANPRHVEAVVA